jgi:MinD-like ATPase involved in chromosome partitioning or flagellar assembly
LTGSLAAEERRLAITSAVAAAFPTARVWAALDRDVVLLRVVSDEFVDLPDDARREIFDRRVPSDLSAASAVLELLTEQEEQWAGPVFRETAVSPPVWSSVLDPPDTPLDMVTFASDLDEGLDSSPVVTFYSLRGGVGRSTALASVARLLTQERKFRVLCIDMDLEAPGLAELFGVSAALHEDRGVLALLARLEFDDVDVLPHVLPVDDAGRLFCLPAGRLGPAYADRLANLDVELWYREQRNPLHRLLAGVAASTLRPDAILVDSRTGFSPIAGPLLFDVSDLAVIFFHPQSQAREGTELLTRAMLHRRTSRLATRPLTPEPRFVVSPMPPGPSSIRYAERASEWVASWLRPLSRARGGAASLSAVDALHVVNYNADVAYRDQVTGELSALAPYQQISDWVLQLVPEASPVDGPPGDKSALLAELSFDTGTAETQDSLLEDFVETEQVRRAASSRVPLIVGRKGTGKTALFRWLAESPSDAAVVVAAPNQYRGRPAWSLGDQGYDAVDVTLNESGRDWAAFWLVHMCLAVEASLRNRYSDLPALPEGFRAYQPGDTELAIVSSAATALQAVSAGLVAADWLQRANDVLLHEHRLLFDGLDTAFGSGPTGKERRAVAVSALLAVQAELGVRVPRLPFKVMLRHDVWESLRLENKSHFFGLQLQLKWEDRAEYYKVVLKRANRSAAFRSMTDVGAGEVTGWTDSDVSRAWAVLISERMKGEQTAFTWNWVWNRLGDGNGDHSPRTLLALFSEALVQERREHLRNPYERSVIRPRLLVPSLGAVSEAALAALVNEEFPELQAVADALRAHGRTPLSVTELGVTDELIEVAVDAGLVYLREDVAGRSVRVPDLYRHALGVTRPGPA